MPPPNDKSSPNKNDSKGIISKFKGMLATKERLTYLYKFSFVVIVYGVLLNFTFATLFASKFQFSFKYLLAMGIGFYFIKEELPRIIGKSFPPRL